MLPDALGVCLAYARAALPQESGGWLVQSKLPADWVQRATNGLFVVRVGAGASGLDSRFDWLTHVVDVDAYVLDGERPKALTAVAAFKDALAAGAYVAGKGCTNEPPTITTAPFEFPDEHTPAGVARVTAAFRATFAP